uniref:Uncharacterized protein LOC114335456 n=1 Tax=Diabrotica virgifera virgifera TaxID=50390 RepID=A0A6P7FYC0_DIAVI
MTLEVCSSMETIEHCDIQFNFQAMEPDQETEIAAENLQNINKELMYQTSTTDIDASMEYLPADIQSCVEIESSNVISIPENQIVEIQFQNETGLINTEYIVNNNLIEADNIINLKDGVYEKIIPYEIYDSTEPSTESFEVVQEMEEPKFKSEILTQSIINIPLLSPQSENDEQNETDLTSLTWLHNITNIMSVPNIPTPPVSPTPKPKRKPTGNQEDLTININYYKKNGEKKPPFSYATLICMAMGKNGNKMTLSAIYHWIRENFLYYRKAHPSWQIIKTIKNIYRNNEMEVRIYGQLTDPIDIGTIIRLIEPHLFNLIMDEGHQNCQQRKMIQNGKQRIVKGPEIVTTVVPVGPNPTHMICPHCHAEIDTTTKRSPGCIAYISSAEPAVHVSYHSPNHLYKFGMPFTRNSTMPPPPTLTLYMRLQLTYRSPTLLQTKICQSCFHMLNGMLVVTSYRVVAA